MIYIDIAEHSSVKQKFIERFGDNCKVKMLGTYSCELNKIPMCKNTKICAGNEAEADLLKRNDYVCDKNRCEGCEHADYDRFADFEIGEGRAFVERKSGWLGHHVKGI